MGILRTS